MEAVKKIDLNEEMFISCEKNFLDKMKNQIRWGADFRANNNEALISACENGHLDVADYLAQYIDNPEAIKAKYISEVDYDLFF